MNYSIIGIGIAVTFAIIALSAITLYLAFRIKETFREEKSLRTQVAKVGFLLGILFLAGGMFYFFAAAMYQPERFQNSTNTSGTIEFDESIKNTSVVLGVSYPDNIKTADKYTISFKVYNPFTRVIHNATIKLIGLSLLEAKSNYNINSDNLKLGDIPPGETSGYLQLEAPSYPVTLEGALILKSEDIDPVTEPVKINVLDINATPSSTPTPNITAAPSTTERPWYYPDIIINWPSSSTPTPKVTPMPSSTSSSSNSTLTPTETPTANTSSPSATPTSSPTESPTSSPSVTPTSSPTESPTPTANTSSPSATPTSPPTESPTSSPSVTPTSSPTESPTPTANTSSPSATPTSSPTESPTSSPSATPTSSPTESPTSSPSATPTSSPTESPTSSPTENPKLPHKSIP